MKNSNVYINVHVGKKLTLKLCGKAIEGPPSFLEIDLIDNLIDFYVSYQILLKLVKIKVILEI